MGYDGAVMGARRGSGRRVRGITLVVAVLGLAACTLGSPAPSAVPSPTPNESPAEASTTCDELNLRTPTGRQLDLTGTWELADVPIVRLVRQIGDCVWWEEFDAVPGEPRAQVYRRVYFGTLQSDLTITGHFGDIFYVSAFDPAGEFCVQLFGRATWRVDITVSGGDDLITLVGPSRGTDRPNCALYSWVFSRTSTSTEWH